MGRLTLIIGIVFFLATKSYSQNIYDFKNVDSLTYVYYEKQDWNSLIDIGKKGIKNNVDYFYLRMRMGIAYYEKQKYRKAADHFKKALSFNAVDEIALEYLYFSYLFGGMKAEAKALTKRFSQALKEKLKLDHYKLLDELYLEGGPTLGNNPVRKGNINAENNDNILLIEEELTNDVRYFSLGLRHSLSKRISMFHSFSTIDIGKNQNINIYNGNVVNDYRIFQRQYYLSFNAYLGHGFCFKPAYHYLNVNYDKLVYSFDENKKLFLFQEKIIMNDYAASATLSKNISLLTLDAGGVMARLNNSKVMQGSLGATIYPLNNLNLYFNSSYTFHDNDKKNNSITEFMAGGKIAKKIWLEGFLTFGNIYNYVEKNAYIVYNITDDIKSRKGVSMKIVVNSNIELSLHYQNLEKRNSFNVINKNEELIIREKNKFINHTIIGGIKWTL